MSDLAYQPVRQRSGRFPCDHPTCTLRYNDRGAALACCSDQFDDDDRHPALANSRAVEVVESVREVLWSDE